MRNNYNHFGTYGLGISVIDAEPNFYTDNPNLFGINQESVIYPVNQPRPVVYNQGAIPTIVESTMATTNNYVAPKPTTSIPFIKTATATMTLKTVVADASGILPLATVTINGEKFATTETGIFQKTNVPLDAVVVISYVGYKTVTYKANSTPARVIMQPDENVLPDLVLHPKPKKKTSWGLWLAITGLIGYGVYKHNQPPKRVKAKI